MAVYTRVEAKDLRLLLANYAVGELEDFAGISSGVTNTNYFVETSLGRWVLTLFEQVEADELPFFMQLMDHLAGHGVPCAHPVARDDGAFLSRLHGLPCALVYRLHGASQAAPETAHCRSLGSVVAEMHRAVSTFTPAQGNARDLGWIERAAQRLDGVLPSAEQALLTDEIAFQRRAVSTLYPNLPSAVVHADLFRDNVLFDDHRVSGVIDFYYACHDYLLFDLAIICNDWAFDAHMHYQPALWQAFMAGYARRYPPDAAARAAWPALLRAAALRFWVSRLIDAYFPMSGEDVHVKDPAPFRQLLLAHRAAAPELGPA
jgi:homoserine kinase type II